jgi:hypothetical protein
VTNSRLTIAVAGLIGALATYWYLFLFCAMEETAYFSGPPVRHVGYVEFSPATQRFFRPLEHLVTWRLGDELVFARLPQGPGVWHGCCIVGLGCREAEIITLPGEILVALTTSWAAWVLCRQRRYAKLSWAAYLLWLFPIGELPMIVANAGLESRAVGIALGVAGWTALFVAVYRRLPLPPKRLRAEEPLEKPSGSEA